MKKVTNQIRSKVMKAAHTIARTRLNSIGWAECLKRAWAWAKENLLEDLTSIVSGDFVRETEKAICIAITGSSFGSKFAKTYNKWIPKSVIVDQAGPNYFVKSWFVEKNF
jgi:hypothetical protein